MNKFKRLLLLLALVGLASPTLLASDPLASPIESVPTDYSNLVIDWIYDNYQLDREWLTVEVLTNGLDQFPDGTRLSILRPLTHKQPLGLFSILVEIQMPGEEAETGQVRLRIRKYAEAVTVNARMRRHAILTEDDLVISRVEVTTLKQRPVPSIGAIVGQRSKRPLRQGSIVTTDMVEPVPAIESGSIVSIVYSTGLCTVTAEGKAMSDGSAGEIIKVRNKSSGKVISARVIDERSVAINP